MGNLKHILIDGDLLVYQSSSAVQKDIDWGNGLFTCHAFLEDAEDTFLDILEGIIRDLKSKDLLADKPIYYFMFTDPDINFRKKLNPNYKSNRKNHRKPTCYWALKDKVLKTVHEHLNNVYTVQLIGVEGDDALGIFATSNPKDSVIVSMDKDFKTIPSYYYNYEKKTLESHFDDYSYWVMFQTLVGDITDGYSGCPGVGKMSAERILKAVSPEDYWLTVVKTYKKRGATFEDALMNYRMAYILHKDNYNLDTGEITLPELKDPTLDN